MMGQGSTVTQPDIDQGYVLGPVKPAKEPTTVRLRKKEPASEAVQFDGTDAGVYRVMHWAHAGLHSVAQALIRTTGVRGYLGVLTASGWAVAVADDWIIRQPGESHLVICKPDKLKAEWEIVP